MKSRYPMCSDQLAQIDCREESCMFHVNARCNNISPAITLNSKTNYSGNWVCHSFEYQKKS